MEEKITLLIEFILQSLELDYTNRVNSSFIVTQNPITHHNGSTDQTHSASFNKSTGTLTCFNGDTLDGNKSVSLEKVCSYLGFQDEYKEILNKDIEDINILYRRTNTIKKVDKAKNPPKEVDLTEDELEKCNKYLSDRGVSSILGLCEPVGLEFDGKYGKFKALYIAFRYPNGFSKYRSIYNSNKKTRFLSFGGDGYKELYCVRNNGSVKAWIGEGETEMLSISQYIDEDVYAMHNLDSIPERCDLSQYDEVTVMIDNDKYDKVAWKLYKEIVKCCHIGAKITIRPKLNIWYSGKWDYQHVDCNGKKQDRDFNDLHKEGRLTKDIIETGLLSESDILGNVEKFAFLRK